MPIFYTLCKEKKTDSFPEEFLDPIGTSAAEEEKSVRDKKREMISAFDNGGKAVYSEAHICTSANDIDTCEIISKHGGSPE